MLSIYQDVVNCLEGLYRCYTIGGRLGLVYKQNAIESLQLRFYQLKTISKTP